LINILLRTHNRPNGYNRILSQIRSQSYKDYRLFISADNQETGEYVKASGEIPIMVNPPEGAALTYTPGLFYPNLYLNDLIEKTEEGYNWIIDDDDYLPDNDVLKTISENLAPDKVAIFKMESIYGVIPQEPFWEQIAEGNVGSPNFVVPTKTAKKIKWTDSSVGDYLYIKEIVNLIGEDNVVWVDKIIYCMDNPCQRGKSEC